MIQQRAISGLCVAAAVFVVGLMASMLHAQERSVSSDAVTRVALVHLTDPGAEVIGVHVTAESLRQAIAFFEEDDRPQVLVLRLATDGGQIAEVPQLADMIHKELLPEMRIVLWVERARSAGAMLGASVPEVVVTSNAIIGPARAHDRADPDDQDLVDDDLATVLAIGVRLSELGQRDPAMLRAMQVPVGYTLDDASVLTAEGDLLALDAAGAVRVGFAVAVADDLSALLGAVGVHEHRLVGERVDRTLKSIRNNLVEAERRMIDAWVQLDELLERVEETTPQRRDIVLAGRDLRVMRHGLSQHPRLAEHMGVTEALLDDRQSRIDALIARLP
ncbi:MAG: hypothetical protein EA380_02185 [Phycisphaeraceae bacterium]|nr:MAG: hypothetical protein EA380_02185 [Phycisphaeraceae bacterium]